MHAFLLAWKQLTFEKMRFFTAIFGVAFACILIFMQLGFKDALFDSATLLQRTMKGDIYILHKQSEALWRMRPFSEQRLYQALSFPEVADITPMYSAQIPWKNPETGQNRTALVLGIDPAKVDVYAIKGLKDLQKELQKTDTVIFDQYSRPEFGDVKSLLEKGPFPVEIGGIKLDVAGMFQFGITFSADGNLIVNDTTFLRMFPNRAREGIDLGIIMVKPGTDIPALKKKIEAALPTDVSVMTQAEYVTYEKAYWQNITPIGYIFNLGVILGFVVGLVIVYQILFTDITNHLTEYATLKAIGYPPSYFFHVVFWSSVFLATLGFLPGFIVCLFLYQVVESAIFIAMDLNAGKIIMVSSLTLTMCFVSGLIATRKLRQADPVELFV